MIPKKIHYCWFGGSQLPSYAHMYISTWQRLMPDYEIVRWDENTFDVNSIDFTAEAYRRGNYAFVSDYVRMKVIYDIGGIYLDTDVEMVKPLYPILEQGAFMGMEKDMRRYGDTPFNIAPGLGFAAESGNSIIGEIKGYYERCNQLSEVISKKTIVVITTEILKRHGYCFSESPLRVEDITIYPPEYFCPKEFLGIRTRLTDHTFLVHHYASSWLSRRQLVSIAFWTMIERLRHKLFRK